MVTTEIKKRIRQSMIEGRENFGGSEAKYAMSLGISAAQYSRVKAGDIERILSDANWLSIARRQNVPLSTEAAWVIANTPVYQFITSQLSACQDFSTSYLLCDMADIGKTFHTCLCQDTHTRCLH